jgi:hypothetical protein
MLTVLQQHCHRNAVLVNTTQRLLRNPLFTQAVSVDIPAPGIWPEQEKVRAPYRPVLLTRYQSDSTGWQILPHPRKQIYYASHFPVARIVGTAGIWDVPVKSYNPVQVLHHVVKIG